MDKRTFREQSWRSMKTKQMFDTLRRTFAAPSAILLCAFLAGCASSGEHRCHGPVGLQLYSMRAALDKDVPDTLAQIKDWGIKYVELAGTYKLTPAEFKKELDAHGLVPVSGHFSFDKWRDDPEGALAEAKTLGLTYVGCAWIPHEGAFDEVACRRAAAVFNHAGELAARQHMHFFYHTHGYEFQPFNNETLFDLLARETNPKYVTFEMDIFWVAHGGQDPARLLEKYPHRWSLMHLKDMKKGTPVGLLTGSSSVNNDVVLGTGQLDMPAILNAAAKVGVKWYFIEDESDAAASQIPQSLRYLGVGL